LSARNQAVTNDLNVRIEGCTGAPMANPIVNPAVGVTPVEGGYLGYDSARDQLHEVNALGALIAELCDGSRRVEDIRALVGPLLPEDKSDKVDNWIADGIDTGLLVWGDGTVAPFRELTAGELFYLVVRLRECGKRQAAYQCSMRLAELKPEDPDAWFALGSAAQAAGLRDQARDAYVRYLECGVEDPAIRHQLVALQDAAPPPRMPDECVQRTFSDFSSCYDTKMREQLSYRAPERLHDLIQSEMGDGTGLEILDIGCGTGLSGVGLKGLAARLTGIDLSQEMIEVARGRGIYDRLEVAEITAWLGQEQGQFDLITACDCLVYFGDLQPAAAGAARQLKPGGVFAFTTERGEKYPFHLTDSGRYSHHPEHVREVAAHAGLIVDRLEEGFLRNESGIAVTGLYALLRKPANG
jgi:predicted TPR repeat methyltransferase